MAELDGGLECLACVAWRVRRQMLQPVVIIVLKGLRRIGLRRIGFIRRIGLRRIGFKAFRVFKAYRVKAYRV